jgi:hypothetical protein
MTAEIKTGVIVPLHKDAQARAEDICARLDSFTANIYEIPALVIKAHQAKDWEALGYPDWRTYVAERYGTRLVKLNRAVRRDWAGEFKAAGMSTREIAPITNVSWRKGNAGRATNGGPALAGMIMGIITIIIAVGLAILVGLSLPGSG